MKAAKGSILLVISLQALTVGQALAGSQSLLDPYAGIQPSSQKAKPTKASTKQPEATKVVPPNRSALSSYGAEEENVPASKPVKQAKVQPEKVVRQNEPEIKPAKKVAQKAPKVSSSQPSFVSGIKEIQSGCATSFKAATSGIFNGTKAAGAKVADGTRRVGASLASGAKASSAYLMKGAGALGHGLKTTATKISEGAAAMGKKIASVPGRLHPSQHNGATAVASAVKKPPVPAVANRSPINSDYRGKPLPTLATKPLVKEKQSGGLITRAFDKFNLFGHNKPIASASRSASTQSNQYLPN